MDKTAYLIVIDEIFNQARALEASEILMFNGSILFVVKNELCKIETTEARSKFLMDNYENIVHSLMGEEQEKEMAETQECSFLFAFEGVRYKVTVGEVKNGESIVFSARKIFGEKEPFANNDSLKTIKLKS